jgi:hypothetical protein
MPGHDLRLKNSIAWWLRLVRSWRPSRRAAAGSAARPPDTDLARAWAEVGQGRATLSHAEAARSVAAAAFSLDQKGVSTYPTV